MPLRKSSWNKVKSFLQQVTVLKNAWMGNLLLEIQNYCAINYKIVILRVELDLDTDLDAMATRSNRESINQICLFPQFN